MAISIFQLEFLVIGSLFGVSIGVIVLITLIILDWKNKDVW